MTDKANELYNKSKAAYEAKLQTEKKALLSSRVLNIFRREGLATNGKVNVPEVKKLIESGEIWRVRGLGPGSIKKICQWVVEQETEEGE